MRKHLFISFQSKRDTTSRCRLTASNLSSLGLRDLGGSGRRLDTRRRLQEQSHHGQNIHDDTRVASLDVIPVRTLVAFFSFFFSFPALKASDLQVHGGISRCDNLSSRLLPRTAEQREPRASGFAWREWPKGRRRRCHAGA